MLNQIVIMGRLVSDPTVRKTANGITVCSFRIACDRDRQVEGGQKADFIDCVAWRATGDFISRYFCKGKPILIQGRLQIRAYQDKDGNKRNATEILVNSAEFCGGNKFDRNTVGSEVPAELDSGSVIPGGNADLSELVGDEDLPWEDHDLK